MERAIRILLQTTIPKTEDDWSIDRFSLLRDYLASIRHESGSYTYDVKAGCPSFLLEPPGNQIEREPEKLHHVKTYVENLARWLAPI